MLREQQSNFYFLHATTLFKGLITILKSGIIYPSTLLEPSNENKYILGFGSKKTEYVYTSIYFDDIKNLNSSFGITLILHPKLINDYDLIFNEKWAVDPDEHSIYISKDDNDEIKKQKLDEIKEFVKNNKDDMDHEVLWKTPILLKDYLIGIICENHDCKLDELKQVCLENNINVPILDSAGPLPTLKSLLKK